MLAWRSLVDWLAANGGQGQEYPTSLCPCTQTPQQWGHQLVPLTTTGWPMYQARTLVQAWLASIVGTSPQGSALPYCNWIWGGNASYSKAQIHGERRVGKANLSSACSPAACAGEAPRFIYTQRLAANKGQKGVEEGPSPPTVWQRWGYPYSSLTKARLECNVVRHVNRNY